jgi:hypothetical protein
MRSDWFRTLAEFPKREEFAPMRRPSVRVFVGSFKTFEEAQKAERLLIAMEAKGSA